MSSWDHIPGKRVCGVQYEVAFAVSTLNKKNKESHMIDANNSTTLPREVVDAELEIIRARRQTTYGNNANQQDQLKDIENNLRGLSISGGGIRSSTFSIGVIQSLAKANLLKDFDYISTVSGGGYTGSLLSTMLNSEDETPDDFPLEMPVGNEESRLLQHLRNGSNYLAPGGFLEFIRMPAVIVHPSIGVVEATPDLNSHTPAVSCHP